MLPLQGAMARTNNVPQAHNSKGNAWLEPSPRFAHSLSRAYFSLDFLGTFQNRAKVVDSCRVSSRVWLGVGTIWPLKQSSQERLGFSTDGTIRLL